MSSFAIPKKVLANCLVLMVAFTIILGPVVTKADTNTGSDGGFFNTLGQAYAGYSDTVGNALSGNQTFMTTLAPSISDSNNTALNQLGISATKLETQGTANTKAWTTAINNSNGSGTVIAPNTVKSDGTIVPGGQTVSLATAQSNLATAQNELNVGKNEAQNLISNPQGIFKDQSNTQTCITMNAVGLPNGINLQFCLAEVSDAMLELSAFVLWGVALLFNYTLATTLNFSQLMQQLPIVDVGWGIFRDLANIFFIFVLLFIAINIILGVERYGAKRLLITVIITALLLNFSLFFTKAIIDVSNILSLAFYSQMNGGGNAYSLTNASGTIAGTIMKGLSLDTILSAGSSQIKTLGSGASISSQLLGNTASGSLSPGVIIEIGICGSILILVTAFVLLAAVVLFMIRTVILIILMMLSPLAFMAMAVPNGAQYGEMWWKKLGEQCIFAPVYMSMMYVVVKVISGNYSGSSLQSGSLLALFTGNGQNINVLFTFGLLISMMGAVILVAAKLGAVGAETALSIGGNIAAAAGAGTIGASANRFLNSNFGRRVLNTVPGGRIIHKALSNVSDSKFGGKYSYNDALKSRAKLEEDFDKNIGTARKAEWKKGDTMATFAARQKGFNDEAKARSDRNKGIIRDADGNITKLKNGKWSSFSRANKIADKDLQTKALKDDFEKVGDEKKKEKAIATIEADRAKDIEAATRQLEAAKLEEKAAKDEAENVDKLRKYNEAKEIFERAQRDAQEGTKNNPEIAEARRKASDAQREFDSTQDPAQRLVAGQNLDRAIAEVRFKESQATALAGKTLATAQTNFTNAEKEVRSAEEGYKSKQKTTQERQAAVEEFEQGRDKHSEKIKKIREGNSELDDLKKQLKDLKGKVESRGGNSSPAPAPKKP